MIDRASTCPDCNGRRIVGSGQSAEPCAVCSDDDGFNPLGNGPDIEIKLRESTPLPPLLRFAVPTQPPQE